MVKPNTFSPFNIRGRIESKPTIAEGTSLDQREGIAVAFGMSGVMRDFLRPQTPYLIEDYRFCMITGGTLYGYMNLIERRIGRGSIVMLCPGSFLEPLEVSEDFNLRGIIVSREVFNVLDRIGTPEELSGRVKDTVWQINEEEMAFTEEMFHLLKQLIMAPKSGRETVLSMTAAIMNHIGDLCTVQPGTQPTAGPSANTIFDRFLSLVNANAQYERQLSFYADKLCISPKYLCNVVRQTSGRTAKEWIDQAVVTYAKVLLRHDTMQVSRIADELNFANPSFFCSYFRRLVGCTPQEYREGK